MNFQDGSGSNFVNNPNYLPIPDLDKVAEEEKARINSQKQLKNGVDGSRRNSELWKAQIIIKELMLRT